MAISKDTDGRHYPQAPKKLPRTINGPSDPSRAAVIKKDTFRGIPEGHIGGRHFPRAAQETSTKDLRSRWTPYPTALQKDNQVVDIAIEVPRHHPWRIGDSGDLPHQCV